MVTASVAIVCPAESSLTRSIDSFAYHQYAQESWRIEMVSESPRLKRLTDNVKYFALLAFIDAEGLSYMLKMSVR